MMLGVFSMFVFSAQEISNSYAYWIQFKPGSFVSFRFKSQIGEVTQETLKIFTLKKISPKDVVIEIKETVPEEGMTDEVGGIRKWIVLGLRFQANEDPFDDDDFFRGNLGVNVYKVINDIEGTKIDEGIEEIEVNRVKLKAERIKVQFDEYETETTISVWLSDEIPGKLAKFTREIKGAVSVKEEIVVTDFKAIKLDPSDSKFEWIKKIPAEKETNGRTFILKNLRFFDDLRLIMKEYEYIKKMFPNRDVSDENYWTEMSDRSKRAVIKAQSWKTHFQEDLKKIDGMLEEEEKEKIECFLKQASNYCVANLDYLMRTSEFISNMIQGPRQMTPEVMFEIEELEKLRDEVATALDKLHDEFKKLEKIVINYEIEKSDKRIFL
jgi:hypothetical protein